MEPLLNPELVVSIAVAGAMLMTAWAPALIADFAEPEDGVTWGDDPAAIAVLSGMSL